MSEPSRRKGLPERVKMRLDLARVLSRFAQPPPVVFVTAHQQPAVEAFELKALDYLLKPVRPERLAESVHRIVHEVWDSKTGGEPTTPTPAQHSRRRERSARTRRPDSLAAARGGPRLRPAWERRSARPELTTARNRQRADGRIGRR